MPNNDIRLVCFDIGGVLVRICRSWPEGCAAAGLPLREGAQAILDRELKSRRHLVRLYQTGKIQTEEYCLRVSETIEGKYTPREIRAIHDAWLKDEYQGLHDVIDAIHEAGYETACLSNINAEHWARMEKFGAFMRLTHHYGSHLIGHHKPDEAIYRHLEQELDLKGHHILFFDDLSENIEAARTRDWRAVQIDHAQPTDIQIVRSLIEHHVIEASGAPDV
jgi:putative hydrolase of the HAD superfamily